VTEFNPPGWLQNAGATHTAAQMRSYIGAMIAGASASGSLVARGGVAGAIGNSLLVTQTGSPSMAVIVKSGVAWAPGSENATQGCYSLLNDADVPLSIAAAHASLSRIDIVCFKVQDSQYSGGANTSSLVVVTGTPAGSPTAPTAPANSLTLAQVLVGPAVTSITNANITDTRRWLTMAGGVIVCTSTSRPASGTVLDGQQIYETDTDKTWITHNGGSTWLQIDPPLGPQGMIKRANRTTSSSTTTTEVGVLRLDGIPIKNGRVYKLCTAGLILNSTVAGDLIEIRIRGNTAGQATTGSTQFGSLADSSQSASASQKVQSVQAIWVGVADVTLSVLLSIARVTGTGTVGIPVTAPTYNIDMWVEDLGPDPTDTGNDV
jgi:hypothetical protein